MLPSRPLAAALLVARALAALAAPAAPPLPLVVWHGLGDAFDSDGMRRVAALAAAVHPGTVVRAVALGADAAADRSASLLGNVSAQLDTVCARLAADAALAAAPAVDALGFSQGGTFLRALVERCGRPRVRALVTFGSPHNGIAAFAACAPADWPCRVATALLRAGTWSPVAQGRVVPAQYFRDPAGDYAAYLAGSGLLADVNNERAAKSAAYRANLARLESLVLYMFDDDTTLVPRRSAWFDEVNGTAVVPLRERALYTEDWLGLRELDRRGGLHFRSVAGEHMQIPDQVLSDAMAEFFGPARPPRRAAVLTPAGDGVTPAELR